MGNTFKTTLLLVALSLFMLFVGEALGGRQGIMLALIFAAVTNFIAYFFSDKIALSMNGAQPVTREDLPRVYEVVERLTQKVGLPMPKIYVIPNESPNAFATGRNPDHSSVAVTQGILQLLTDEELEGVLAHELGHVRNRDTLIMTMTATIAGAISMLANFGLFFGGGDRERGGGNTVALILAVIVAPFAAMLVQLAISRAREYGADRGGAEMHGNPRKLASALAKLAHGAQRIPNPVAAANPAAAALYIVPGLGRGDSWFSTHPATENRIAALEAMAAGPHSHLPSFEESPVRIAGASVPRSRKAPTALDPHGRRS